MYSFMFSGWTETRGCSCIERPIPVKRRQRRGQTVPPPVVQDFLCVLEVHGCLGDLLDLEDRKALKVSAAVDYWPMTRNLSTSPVPQCPKPGGLHNTGLSIHVFRRNPPCLFVTRPVRIEVNQHSVHVTILGHTEECR